MYYLEAENASARPFGGMHALYYLDTLNGPGKVQGPWCDAWRQAIKNRFHAWFAEFARINGTVDLILSDFEMGGHSSSFNWVNQPTADGSDPIDALLADSRWPALQQELTHDARGS